MQYQFGIEPMGTQGGGGQFAFAQNPQTSYFNYQDSPYTDFYARQSGLVANLQQATKSATGGIITKSLNPFLEDINMYKNLKILRIFENVNLNLDIYISFLYENVEFFGAFKNYNGVSKPKLQTELFYDTEYKFRFDGEYKIRLSNYFYKKLEKWFIPDDGFYKNLKNDNIVKDSMGKMYELDPNKTVEVLGYNITPDKKPYIILKCDGEIYHIEGNDYYFFKWRFEKINEKI